MLLQAVNTGNGPIAYVEIALEVWIHGSTEEVVVLNDKRLYVCPNTLPRPGSS